MYRNFRSFSRSMLSSDQIFSIRRKLLHWYKKTRRDLPWRRTRDPYAIWIAETMLQQTQVATVTRYYERFLEAFPSIAALDRARLSTVLTLWSGLGYYRRAVNLKKSARVIVRDHSGQVPDTYPELRDLPGVGDYTAGAVLSIAFGKRFPAVDGNARRVLGRAFGVNSEKEIRQIAARLVPSAKAGYFNQALMELGATLCAPKKPRCSECPWNSDCRTTGTQDEHRVTGVKIRSITWPMAIVRNSGTILIRRRAGETVLSGLWEFPGGEIELKESARGNLRRHLRILPGTLSEPRQIGEIQHAITNRKIRVPVFLLDYSADTGFVLPRASWRWVKPGSLRKYPLSSMTLKAAGIFASYEDRPV
jgi:A/G-specific adenine glycosylase